ncbi:bifunctional Sec7 domain/Guanine nucleotide exchange factor [Babesia duncani]|uniref:Bifunctional Sec7 domain/Guanine nucleotide exchange factor n=1 Tax=Babesia duncani TaxID=323732 RepID=A0AAD9PK30_9APIC|nr:bifunctional Sec7 domain/Guanine nucleotide exchange factor [Babesia duncani]
MAAINSVREYETNCCKTSRDVPNYRPNIRRIEIINLEAYHLISALKDHVKSYVSSVSLVPVLGSESASSRNNHDTNLIRHLKQLAWRNVENEQMFMDFENIRPFLDVLKSFDAKHDNIVLICIEALSKMANCETVKIDPVHAPLVLNMVFEGILSVFTNNIEPKEDLITLKILQLLGYFLTCKGGCLITNDNVVKMFKIIVTVLTARHRNSAIRKLIHDCVVNLLQYSQSPVANSSKSSQIPNDLLNRCSSTYLFIGLLISHSMNENTFNLHTEDTYLALRDNESLSRFRAEFSHLVQNISSIPTMWNEFCDDICIIGLRGFNQSIELAKFDTSVCPRIIPIVQAHITNSLYRMFFTESLSKYSLVLRSMRNLYSFFRTSLKSQLEVYLTHMIGSIINFIYPHKGSMLKSDITEMNMEFLLEFCQNPQFLMELYVNYDCDIKCSNLFDLLIKGLVSCIYPIQDVDNSSAPSTPMQYRGRKSQTKYASKKKAGAQSGYKSSYTSEQTPEICLEPMAICAIQDILRFISYDGPNDEDMLEAKTKCGPFEQKKLKKKLQQGANIFNTSDLGDKWIDSVKQIGLMPEKHTARDVALFLKYVPDLNKRKVGEYLGTHKNMEFMDNVRKEFTRLHNFEGLPIVMAIRLFLSSFRLPGESQQIERIIEVFAATYFECQPLVEEDTSENATPKVKPRWIIQENFFNKPKYSVFDILNEEDKGISKITVAPEIKDGDVFPLEDYFLKSNRKLIISSRFAHQCQLIRDTPTKMTAAASHTNEKNGEGDDQKSETPQADNVGTLRKKGFAYVENSDTIFVLSYSIIMLNTDLHNTQIKKKMKLEDFVRNNKTINNGKDLPYEFLEDIYQSIKNHEIKLHQNGEQVEVFGYDPYFWVDHVLLRQEIVGNFDAYLSTCNYTIKREMFNLLCQNDIVHAMDNAYATAETVYELKQCIRVFWLLVSVGIKFSKHELVNSILQLNSITVTDSLTYRCQLSICFLLNVLATASRFFDSNSWSKLTDLLIKLYSLNLIPITLASMDIDPRIYGQCKPLSDYLFPPSIRFKRYSDVKKNAGWLGGWTNFIPFNRSTLVHEIGEGDESPKDNQGFVIGNDLDADVNKSKSCLFLFDVQSGAMVIQNQYFDVSALGADCNPVATKDDELAIAEVTRAFSNDLDKEELLPQVLSYMNLRLAFLNIYNLDKLVMGGSTNVPLTTFSTLLDMILVRVFKPLVSNAPESQVSNTPEFSFTEGALLDPCPKEISQFQNKVDALFCLGMFTRFVKIVLVTCENENEEQVEKAKLALAATIQVFYNLSKTCMMKEIADNIPVADKILKKIGITSKINVPEPKMLIDPFYASYVCISLIKMVYWFNEKSNAAEMLINGENAKAESATGSQIGDVVKIDIYLTTSAWLLHLVIHYNGDILWNHWESLVKVLYYLASNSCLHRNMYLVMVIQCACQRLVNPLLPFGQRLLSNTTSNVVPASFNFTLGSILPILLQRSKCLHGPNSFAMARACAQTLLSIALFCKPNPKSNNVDTEDWNDNLIAVQLLIEFRTFTHGTQEEYIWLLSVHSLSIICTVGPCAVYFEAMKGLTKLLLQDSFPPARCSSLQQLARIFDYILAPTLTNKFHYPLWHTKISNSLSDGYEDIDYSDIYWSIPDNFGDDDFVNLSSNLNATWMSKIILNYAQKHKNDNVEDMATRKAAITNLICHVMLSKLSVLTKSQLETATLEQINTKASSLECLLYTSDEEICGPQCIKRFITATQYMLGVIIPSNGECASDPNNDTFVESLKNFILVILTCPELKSAPENCTQHFTNDHELKECLGAVKDTVDFTNISRGEYVFASLLAHMFSTTDALKELFFDILRVVFPKL